MYYIHLIYALSVGKREIKGGEIEMIQEKVEQGFYCTICQTSYSHYENIPVMCLNGQCKRGK